MVMRKNVIRVAVVGWVVAGAVTATLAFTGHNGGHVTTLSAAQISTQLGLGENVTEVVYNDKTDPNGLMGRQGQYTSKVSWEPKGASADEISVAERGSSIEVFSSAHDAQGRYDYLQSFNSAAFLADGYDYVAGSALLRLNKSYTPAEAHDLENWFHAAAGR
jgi:hypothetical protein